MDDAKQAPLRILVLEDDDSDAELVTHKLQRAGVRFESFRVDNGKAFLAALGDYPADLLLADFSLPGFTALDALDAIREKGLDLPTILVTGSQGEEVAVECMKRGASDFILKDRLDLLPPAIRRTLEFREAQRAQRDAQSSLELSERRFRELADNLPEIVFEADLHGCFTFVNRTAFRLSGYGSEDLGKGVTIFDLVAPEERGTAGSRLARVLVGEDIGIQEYTLVRRDGTRFSALIHSLPLVQDGAVTGFRGVVLDITERKITEEALATSEFKYRTLYEGMRDGFVRVALDGTILEFNEAYRAQTGYEAEGLRRLTYQDLTPEKWHEGEREIVAKILATGDSGLYEKEYRRKDGSTVPIELRTLLERDSRGRPVSMSAIVRDISDRKEAEAQLRENEERYRSIFTSSQDAVFLGTPEGRILDANPAACAMFRRSREELIEVGRAGTVVPTDPNLALAFEEWERTGSYHGELAFLRGDAERFQGEITLARFFTSAGEHRLNVVIRDITERKRAEEEIRFQRERFEMFSRDAPFGLMVQDAAGKVTYLNRKFTDLFGYTHEEVPDRKSWRQRAYPDPSLRRQVEEAWQGDEREIPSGEPRRRVFSIQCMDGSDKKVQIISSLLEDGQALITFEDVTEKERAAALLAASEKRYRSLFENNLAGVYRSTVDGRLLEANEALARIYGYGSARELLAKQAENLYTTPEDRERFIATLRENRILVGYESVGRTRAGQDIHLLENVALTDDPALGIPVIEGTLFDITARKRMEKELFAERAKLRTVLESMNDGVYISNWDHDLEYVNPVLEGIFGSIRGRKCYKYLHGRSEPCPWCQNEKVFAGETVTWEHHFPMFGRTMELYDTPITNPDGTLLKLEILHDITGRKRAEEELRERELMFRTLAESMNEGLMRVDDDDVIQYVNPRLCDMLGYASEEMLGRVGLDLIIPEEERDRIREKNASRREGRADRYESQMRKKGGEILQVEVSGSPALGPGGVPVGSVGLITDITERKRAEEALRLSEQLFREFFERNPAASYMSTVSGELLSCNEAFLRLFGFANHEEALSCRISDLYENPRDREEFVDTVRREHSVSLRECLFRSRSGKDVAALATAAGIFTGEGELTGVIGFMLDLTANRALHAQFLHAQKMEAVGRLAGGIAHDYNNILTTILTFAELTAEDLPRGTAARHSIEQIHAAAERAAKLTRQLLAYSRQQVFQMKPLDLRVIAENTLRMVSRILGEGVEAAITCEEGLWTIQGDEGQLEQVIMNLLVNARDAMDNGGKVTVLLYNIAPGPVDETHSAAAAAPRVFLKVTDTGVGMSPEVASHIFDPYFTTKGREKGTGLGLSVVEGIVKQHGGSIQVFSEMGVGTTFTLSFPATTDSGMVPEREVVTTVPRGRETILLVEDEEGVRESTRIALESLGYTVFAANNATHALQVFESVGEQIKLVLSDMLMPGGISGRTLCEGLKRRRPSLKTILMSGHTDDVLLKEGVSAGEVHFIGKPFTRLTLASKIRQILDH